MKVMNAVLLNIVLGLIALNSQAGTTRVLVTMKTPSAYVQVQNNFQQFGTQNLKVAAQRWGMAPHALSQVDGQIESTLKNLNSVILTLNDSSEIERLKLNPAIESVDREIFYPAPKPVRGFVKVTPGAARKKVMNTLIDASVFAPTVQTPWGILAVHSLEAWPTSHQGEGTRVLVLDTGIDKDHPSLKPNFEKGKSFVGANNGLPYEYFDDVGHGSHCSGTIAGAADSTGFTGVAPKAKLLMGKVCTPNGCSNLAVAQGINWGIEEKVDVISMSLGGSQSTPSERKAVAAAAKAGVVVVAASGNDAENEQGVVSYPAALPTVIAVGAIDSSLKRASFSQWGPELAVVGPGVDVLSTVPQGSGRAGSVIINLGSSDQQIPNSFLEGTTSPIAPLVNELVDAGLGKPADFAKVNVAGKIALIQRGEIPFHDKVQNALAAKAAAIVFYNNAPGLLHGSLKSDDGSDIAIPAFMIEQSQGKLAQKSIASGNTVKVTLQVVKTDFANFDGTSMATPHVAGVAALIKATNKALSPEQVKEILKQTATPIAGQYVNETGSGLVQADQAVQKASQTQADQISLRAL